MMKRSLLFLVVLGFTIASLVLVFIPSIGKHDFAAYWTSSYLLLNRKDPYDLEQMAIVQRSTNQLAPQKNETVLIAWNPPWLLILLIPLAALPFNLAGFIWMWLTIVGIGLSIYLCMNLTGQPVAEHPFIWIFTACLLFGPVIILLTIGQVSWLILLSLVIGIYFLRRGSYAAAGAFLVLATIKPHISYLALAWIGWWVLRNRKWSVIVSAFSTIFISIAITLLLFPNYLASYSSLLFQNMQITNWFASTLWSFLEINTGRAIFHWFGVLLLPLVFILHPSGDQEDWLAKLSLILVASISLAPYGFSFDQVVLLPVIVQILLWIKNGKLKNSPLWITVGGLVALYTGLYFLMSKTDIPYYWYFWVPFVLWGVYGYSYWVTQNRNDLSRQ